MLNQNDRMEQLEKPPVEVLGLDLVEKAQGYQ